MTPADILEYCLEEIEAGRKTPAECVRQFPEGHNLEVQLRAAQILRAYPAPNLRALASHQIEHRLRQHLKRSRPRQTLSWKLALVMLLLVGLGTSIQLISISVPGDAFYQFKRLTETTQIGLIPPSAHASQYLIFADRRLTEITQLAQRRDLHEEALAELLTDLNYATESALSMMSQAPRSQQSLLLQAIVQTVEQETALLQGIQPHVSAQTQVLVQQALAKAEVHTTLAVEHLNEINQKPDAGIRLTTTVTSTSTAWPTRTNTATDTSIVLATSTLLNPNPTHTPLAPSSYTPTWAPTATSPSATFVPTDYTPTPPGRTQPPLGQLPTLTATAAEPEMSSTPPASTPNCHAQNSSSLNYCTPAPMASTPTVVPPTIVVSTPTPCPTNASGGPKCHP